MRKILNFSKNVCTKYMASSEAMTSSTRSFAYPYRLVKKCFVKICETSNFLIFQPIFIRVSLFFVHKMLLFLVPEFPFKYGHLTDKDGQTKFKSCAVHSHWFVQISFINYLYIIKWDRYVTVSRLAFKAYDYFKRNSMRYRPNQSKRDLQWYLLIWNQLRTEW